MCNTRPFFIPRLCIGSQIIVQKVYHEVYEHFFKRDAGNYSVDRTGDGAILLRRHDMIPESVRCIEMGERFTCNVQHCFEAQCINEYDADGGFVIGKWNPLHLMVDTYYHFHEVDEVVIGSVNSDTFTCTLDDTITCNFRDSGVVHDQSIIPPVSNAEDNVNFTDDVNVASFDEPENYITVTTLRSINPECDEFASTFSGLESDKKIETIGELRRFIDEYTGMWFHPENQFQISLPSVA